MVAEARQVGASGEVAVGAAEALTLGDDIRGPPTLVAPPNLVVDVRWQRSAAMLILHCVGTHTTIGNQYMDMDMDMGLSACPTVGCPPVG